MFEHNTYLVALAMEELTWVPPPCHQKATPEAIGFYSPTRRHNPS
uniref:Uncharacterized protein n=1 Tax=Arundo donax TaxID=35708 RepID=A0A0A9C1W9_ARUDO